MSLKLIVRKAAQNAKAAVKSSSSKTSPAAPVSRKAEKPHSRSPRTGTITAAVETARRLRVDNAGFWIGKTLLRDSIASLVDAVKELHGAALATPPSTAQYLIVLTDKTNVCWPLLGLNKSKTIYSRKHTDDLGGVNVRGSIPELMKAYGKDAVILCDKAKALKLGSTYRFPAGMIPTKA